MDDENLDEQEVLTKPDANVDESTDTNVTNEDTQDDIDVEALKAELDKYKEDYHNQKIRAEKAESKLKSGNSTGRGETFKSDGLSALDIIAVTNAKLDEDSLKEVMDYSKFKKISVSEALKAPAVKAILANLEETKRTAEATNTSYTRRGSSKVSDEALVDQARKGAMPDSDADIKRLVQLKSRRR